MSNHQLLCFTNSYRRPYHLYHTINSILNQKYTKFDYAVGISVDDATEEDLYLKLLKDFIASDKRLKIFFHKNFDQHDNYLYPIKQTNYKNYKAFAKIDDDDIYKSSYLEHCLTIYKQKKVDILSSNIKYEINNDKIYEGIFDNVGGHWQGDLNSNIQFGMPFSYIFNNKCLDVLLNTTAQELYQIHPFEDPGWRTKWREANITSYVIQDSDLAIYHIHGKNISSSKWLIHREDLWFENDVFIICLAKHIYWQSYIILNKINNMIYNIKNHDLGHYNINNNILTVHWDNYQHPERFKSVINNNLFSYEYIND